MVLRQIHGDPRAAATLSVDGLPLPPVRTETFASSIEQHWLAHDYGVRIFTCGSAFVGYCGLRHVAVEGEPAIELLYAVHRDRWNQGYAQEMARATLADGFERCALTDIVCFTLPTNVRSRRVMEACGFVYQRGIVHAGMPHVLYALTISEWTAAVESGQRGG